MKKILIIIFFLIGLVLIPFVTVAITNSEIIAILVEGIKGTRLLLQDAYCAAGVTAFCP